MSTTRDKIIIYLSKDSKKTKIWLSEKLGISRPTLDKRLKTGDWKSIELFTLETILK
jgi:DNA-binding Xre family transcriptional regulator